MHLTLSKGSLVDDKTRPMVPAISDHSIQLNDIAYTNSFIYLVICTKKALREVCCSVTYSAPKPAVLGISENAV